MSSWVLRLLHHAWGTRTISGHLPELIRRECDLFGVAETNPPHASARGFHKLPRLFLLPKSTVLITPFHSPDSIMPSKDLGEKRILP